jgi:hypothetical protein
MNHNRDARMSERNRQTIEQSKEKVTIAMCRRSSDSGTNCAY